MVPRPLAAFTADFGEATATVAMRAIRGLRCPLGLTKPACSAALVKETAHYQSPEYTRDSGYSYIPDATGAELRCAVRLAD